MKLEHLIRASGAFMIFCAHWASLQREFHLPERRAYKFFDRLTMVWSVIVLLTCSYKFFNTPSYASIADDKPPHDWKWLDLLTLNYLPHIFSFAGLYYALVMTSIAIALIWRCYLIFFRHTTLSEMFVKRSGKVSTKLAGPRFDPHASASQQEMFDAKLEVINFFMHGPQKGDPSAAASRKKADELIERHFARNFTHLDCSDSAGECGEQSEAAYILDGWPANRHQARPIGLLACAHGESTLAAMGCLQTYQVPIRNVNLLEEKSEERWLELAAYVYGIVIYALFVSVPLVSWVVSGLARLTERFGHSLDERNEAQDPSDWITRRQFVLFIRVYAAVEQAYTIAQLTLFFIFTNIFITLFYADLMRKVRPILKELEGLLGEFASRRLESLPVRQLHRNQLRIWCYFDQLDQLDDFMSRYALVSLAQLAVGVTLSLSFVKLDEPKLRLATWAGVISNTMSFTFLYLVSEHVERKSNHIHRHILSIVAAEREPLIKREWQRLLRGFFQSNRKRTFTIIGRYPVNLRTYVKVSFWLAIALSRLLQVVEL